MKRMKRMNKTLNKIAHASEIEWEEVRIAVWSEMSDKRRKESDLIIQMLNFNKIMSGDGQKKERKRKEVRWDFS